MNNIARNKEVYLAFSAAWEAGDLDRVMSYVTDDMIYSASIGPEPGTTYRGRNEVRAGIAAIIAHDSASSVEITALHAEGDLLFPMWTYHLPDGGVARGMDVIELRDGVICRKDGYRKCRVG
jgi:ketosteroid isomerase-like protein